MIAAVQKEVEALRASVTGSSTGRNSGTDTSTSTSTACFGTSSSSTNRTSINTGISSTNTTGHADSSSRSRTNKRKRNTLVTQQFRHDDSYVSAVPSTFGSSALVQCPTPGSCGGQDQ